MSTFLTIQNKTRVPNAIKSLIKNFINLKFRTPSGPGFFISGPVPVPNVLVQDFSFLFWINELCPLKINFNS